MCEKTVNTIKASLKPDEAAVITSGPNRFYVTGFNSSAGTVVITAKTATFLIDFRYFEKAKSVVSSCDVVLSSRSVSEIKDILTAQGVKRVYIEADRASVSQLNSYRKEFDGIEVSDDDKLDRMLEDMRCIKTEKELEYIKYAQKLTDDTFSYILNNIKTGRTEREVMHDKCICSPHASYLRGVLQECRLLWRRQGIYPIPEGSKRIKKLTIRKTKTITKQIKKYGSIISLSGRSPVRSTFWYWKCLRSDNLR